VRPGVPDCQIHLNVPAGNVAGRIITNAPSAFFTVVMLIIIGRKSNEPANQFGKKRKACQYVTCIGTMLFFDGTGNPWSNRGPIVHHRCSNKTAANQILD
jgi:hypothetical protein